MLEEGFTPLVKGLFFTIPVLFSELVVFVMIFPNIIQPQAITKKFLLGTLIGGVVLAIVTALSVLILSADITARNMYPSYALAKRISIGDFLERIEAIMAMMWFITLYFKITLLFYGFIVGLAHLFRLREFRMLVLPAGLLVFIFSILIAPNITYYNEVITKYWPYFDIQVGILSPLLVYLVFLIRKRFQAL